ncbi:MAG: AAA family ATPase, partial [Patescibacteria group bacterium]
MYLKSLELTGFKSFAKKTGLDFKTSITAVVGPNGSGKSNIAEAFRFVLGEQSIKSMRGKKSEDLIFNGSKEFPKGNRASAKITFDNRKRLLNLDFDEVSIERSVFRDSTSEYRINDSQVRLKDIIELLAQAHIGASGHHIISQGEADRVLSASIKERRAMIEDALGLKIYQYKKQESERKLDKTAENIKQVESLRREIAPHIKFLKKQVEKIERAQAMREDLKALYREYFRREHIYLEYFKKKLRGDRAAPEAQMAHLEKEMISARKTLESASQKDQKTIELVSIESSLASVRTERDSATYEKGKVEGLLEYAKKRLTKAESAAKEAADVSVPLREVESLGEGIASDIDHADSKDPSALIALVRSIKEKISAFIAKSKVATNTALVSEITAEIKELDRKLTAITAEVSTLDHKLSALESAYRTVKESIEKEKDVNREAEKALFRIVAEQNELRGILTAISAHEERLRVEETNFKNEVQEGVALVGRDISSFYDHTVTDADEVVANAPRHEQEDRRRAIEKIKIRLEDAGIGGSDDVMKEFKEVSEREAFLTKELLDLEQSAKSLTDLIKELELRLDVEFREGIKKINGQFQEFFALMFGGGHASLDVVREQKRKKSDTAELLEIGEVSSIEDIE